METVIVILDLRTEARHLENEIDAKLVSLSKLGLNYNSVNSSLESIPLLDEEHVFENMASGIESLLTKVDIFLINIFFHSCHL